MEITKEMHEHFILRTRAHLYLLRKWSDKIADYNHPSIDNSELLAERDSHDQSKFKDPEITPYIHITWRYRQQRYGKEYILPEEMSVRLREATYHHIKHNKHHPEAWDDEVTIDCLNPKDRDKPSGYLVNGTNMPLSYIGAMCADWFAMSEELRTNPREWADNNINVRWKFTDDQIGLIYDLIDNVWERNYPF